MIDKIDFTEKGDAYQTKTISAGNTGIVFSLTMPSGYRGFLEEINISLFEDAYSVLKIDGVETIRLVEAPMNFKRPALIERTLEVISHNNSENDYDFETFIKGFCVDFAYEIRKLRNAII